MEESEPGTKALEEYLDKKICCLLRDSKYLIGVLRSFDQYNNLLMEDVKERVFFKEMYSEKEVAVYVVRGENIVLLGDYGKDTVKKQGYVRKECKEISRLSMEEKREKEGEAGDEVDLDFISLEI